MTIHEPMTMATDYLLGGVAAWIAFVLFRKKQASQKLWAVAFAALAIASFAGGTHHGFAIEALWKPTLLVMGLASFGMVAGSAFAAVTGAPRAALVAAAAIKLLGYWAWVSADQRFLVVVLDTVSAMLVVAVLHLFDRDRASARWILAGVAVSVAAGGIQAARVAPHPHFNHNDLYHLVQLAAVYFYFRGVSRMQDKRRFPR